MRRRNIKNAGDKITKYSDFVVLDPTLNKGKWNEVFGNDNPIYIEIGMGKGKFILEHARNNPNINYVGIEKFTSIALTAAKFIDEYEISNLYIINYDAIELEKVFDKEEVSKIYLNFSDPWPKSRHGKRRLTSSDFLSVYKNILSKDADIEQKTDNQKLFEYSVVSFNNFGLKFDEIYFDLHNNEFEKPIITTEYEDKFKAKGNPIYMLKCHFDNEN